MDAVGVALAAAQGLYAENQELKAEITNQQEQLNDLAARLSALEAGHKTNSDPFSLSWLLGFGLLVPAAGVWYLRRER